MAFLNLKVCEREINLTRNNQFQNLTLTITSSNYGFVWIELIFAETENTIAK